MCTHKWLDPSTCTADANGSAMSWTTCIVHMRALQKAAVNESKLRSGARFPVT